MVVVAELIITVKHVRLLDEMRTCPPLDSTDASLLETALMYAEQDEPAKAQEYLDSMTVLGLVRAVRNFSSLAVLVGDTWEGRQETPILTAYAKRNRD